jgi:hypothetical protein
VILFGIAGALVVLTGAAAFTYDAIQQRDEAASAVATASQDLARQRTDTRAAVDDVQARLSSARDAVELLQLADDSVARVDQLVGQSVDAQRAVQTVGANPLSDVEAFNDAIAQSNAISTIMADTAADIFEQLLQLQTAADA